MGTFRVAIEIGDAVGERWETIEALVDTGATYTTVPAELLRRLGVMPYTRDTFVLADGRRVEHDIGQSWIRVRSFGGHAHRVRRAGGHAAPWRLHT